MHFLLGRHLLDGVVIDLLHRRVGDGGFAGLLQQRFHQHPVAVEGEPALDVGIIADLLLLGRLRHHDDVGQIGDQVVALLLRPHLRHVAADLLLGEGKIAFVNIDAVGAGHHGTGILRPQRCCGCA